MQSFTSILMRGAALGAISLGLPVTVAAQTPQAEEVQEIVVVGALTDIELTREDIEIIQANDVSTCSAPPRPWPSADRSASRRRSTSGAWKTRCSM